jgi:hypothetical protein
MGEAEYDRVMDAVREAVEPVPTEDSLARLLIFHQLSKAANDNLGLSPAGYPISRKLVEPPTGMSCKRTTTRDR